MSIEIPFKRLSDADELLPFDCGDEDLNNYLFSDALSYQTNYCLSLITWTMEMKRFCSSVCPMTRLQR